MVPLISGGLLRCWGGTGGRRGVSPSELLPYGSETEPQSPRRSYLGTAFSLRGTCTFAHICGPRREEDFYGSILIYFLFLSSFLSLRAAAGSRSRSRNNSLAKGGNHFPWPLAIDHCSMAGSKRSLPISCARIWRRASHAGQSSNICCTVFRPAPQWWLRRGLVPCLLRYSPKYPYSMSHFVGKSAMSSIYPFPKDQADSPNSSKINPSMG